MAKPKIMLVTTDHELTKTSQAELGEEFELTCLDSAEEALTVLAKDSHFMVVISGLTLPGMDGGEFLTTLHTNYKKIFLILASGTCDLEMAVKAVNSAHISQILTKPISPNLLKDTVLKAIAEYSRIETKSIAMKDTLLGCVRMLGDILEHTHPAAVRQCKRIRRRAQHICKDLKAMSSQQMDIVVLLSNIGCVGLPSSLLKKMEIGKNINKEDMKTFRTHPEIAGLLLENVPKMNKVADIIRHQNTPHSQNPPLGARILKVCIDLDQMQLIDVSRDKAMKYLRSKPDMYDPDVIDSIERYQGKNKDLACAPITIAELEPGMIMQRDMVTQSGVVLLHKGDAVSEASHMRLQAFSDLLQVKAPLCAAQPTKTTA
ncbi:MAG: response regulator [Pseudodesulfovibrio sp.]